MHCMVLCTLLDASYLVYVVQGHYNVNDAGSQSSSNLSLSCFRSTTSRIPSSVTHQGPGPATYSPYRPPEPLNRTTLP